MHLQGQVGKCIKRSFTMTCTWEVSAPQKAQANQDCAPSAGCRHRVEMAVLLQACLLRPQCMPGLQVPPGAAVLQHKEPRTGSCRARTQPLHPLVCGVASTKCASSRLSNLIVSKLSLLTAPARSCTSRHLIASARHRHNIASLQSMPARTGSLVLNASNSVCFWVQA